MKLKVAGYWQPDDGSWPLRIAVEDVTDGPSLPAPITEYWRVNVPALMNLAEEMSMAACELREFCEPFDAEELSGYAKRIRALLGVTDG